MTNSFARAGARVVLAVALVAPLAACTSTETTGSTQTLAASSARNAAKPADCDQFRNNRDGLNRASDVAEIPVGVGGLLNAVGVSNRVANVGYRAKSVAYNSRRINRGSAALANC